MTSSAGAALCPLPIRIVWLFAVILTAGAQSPPRLLPEAFDLERVVPEGTIVQLPCPVEGDPDTLFREWYRDREPLGNFGDDRYRQQTNGGLRIKGVIPQDTGLYVCRAVNGFGRVDVNVTLIVLGSPDTLRSGALEDDDYDENFSIDGAKIFDDDVDEYAEESFNSDRGKPRLIQVSKFQGSVIQRFIGTSITLRCIATADPRPQVTWLKNGKPLPDSNLPSNTRGHFTLILNNLQVSDTGNYTCQVYNGLGSVSASFVVKVIDQVRTKPEFIDRSPKNVTVMKGEAAILECLLQSDVAPHVQWLKQTQQGVREDEDFRGHYKSFKIFGGFYQVLKSTDVTETPDGSFRSRLIIPEVRQEHSGKYICVGANRMGYNSKGAFLTVLSGSPSPQLSQQTLSIPFPIVVAIGVSGVIVLIGVIGLLLYCRSKRFLPPSSRVTTATNTTTSSKGSVSADVKHSYVGMAYHPQVDAMREDIGVVPSGRMYIPSGQLHRTVPLNSIFL